MPSACCVTNCKHIWQKCKLKIFPSDETRSKQWENSIPAELINLKTQNPKPRICVCHFSEAQFETRREDGLRRLRPDALPTVFTSSKESSFSEITKIKQEPYPTVKLKSNPKRKITTNANVQCYKETKTEKQSKTKEMENYEKTRHESRTDDVDLASSVNIKANETSKKILSISNEETKTNAEYSTAVGTKGKNCAASNINTNIAPNATFSVKLEQLSQATSIVIPSNGVSQHIIITPLNALANSSQNSLLPQCSETTTLSNYSKITESTKTSETKSCSLEPQSSNGPLHLLANASQPNVSNFHLQLPLVKPMVPFSPIGNQDALCLVDKLGHIKAVCGAELVSRKKPITLEKTIVKQDLNTQEFCNPVCSPWNLPTTLTKELASKEFTHKGSHKIFATFCRVCALNCEPLNLVSIFGEEGAKLKLRQMIDCYLPIKVLKNDRLPRQVCKCCITILSYFKKISRSSIEAHNKLRQMLFEEDEKEISPNGKRKGKSETFHEVKKEKIDTTPSDTVICCKEIRNPTNVEAKKSSAPLVSVIPNSKNQILGVLTRIPKLLVKSSQIEEHQHSSHSQIVLIPSSEAKQSMFQVSSVRGNQIQSPIVPINISKFESSRNLSIPAEKTAHANHYCKLCQKIVEFPSEKEIHEHIEKCTAKTQFVCIHCEKLFKSKKVMITHINLKCKSFKCKHCNKTFKCRKDCNTYLDNHRSNIISTSEICDKTFTSKELENENFDTHPSACEKDYTCPECGEIFKMSQSFKNHMVTHDMSESFSCLICQKKFSTRAKVSIHLKNHSIDRKYFDCHECGYRAYRKYSLMRHITLKHLTCNYICSICNKICPDITSMETHYNSHTLEEITIIEFKRWKAYQRVTDFHCKPCNKYFNHKYMLENHLKLDKAQNIEEKEKSAKDIDFESLPSLVCEICGFRFYNKTSLTKHKQKEHETDIPEKKHTCTICDKCFAKKQQLKNHMWHHTGKKPFTCRFCDCGFTSRTMFDEHLMKHQGVKPFTCRECEKSFYSLSALKFHIRFKHLNPQVRELRLRLQCSYCKKKFSDHYHLEEHVRIHTGDKPYSCDLCSNTYSQKVALNRHRLKMHTIAKIHKCSHCPVDFEKLDELKEHEYLVHRITKHKIIKCLHCDFKCYSQEMVSLHETSHVLGKLQE